MGAQVEAQAMVITLHLLHPHNQPADQARSAVSVRALWPKAKSLPQSPSVVPRSACRPLSRRQALPSTQDTLLTMLLAAQTSKASTGPSSLGLEPKAPSPGPRAPPSPWRAPLPEMEGCMCLTTIAPSQCPTCPCRSPSRRLPPSLSRASPMRSRSVFSRGLLHGLSTERLVPSHSRLNASVC